jgi:hypothetical protein
MKMMNVFFGRPLQRVFVFTGSQMMRLGVRKDLNGSKWREPKILAVAVVVQ